MKKSIWTPPKLTTVNTRSGTLGGAVPGHVETWFKPNKTDSTDPKDRGIGLAS
ncbi:hypothetical protein PQO03_13385 [Lentisphaera profundi]|uniref:Lasso RiPP family leader peptide-containing protein n=1 Tax=Lentisphaera profundi TaxID=1658616 RepID=A0ABY7VYN2_9BACT|nr:hypothetical protein [Lentisphaera profundi]WDE98827.1 hypothetical protein PQO03_13385 [Lentisphaera profundi]